MKRSHFLRKTSLLLVAVVMIQATFFGFLSYGEEEGATENKWKREIEAVCALGYMENISDENVNALISRGDFALCAARLGGCKVDEVKTRERYFYDVPANSKYAAAVEFDWQMGYIDGNNEQMFEPDEMLTVGQCVKIMVSVLGYKQLANYNGGYPTGYYSMAAKLKLLSGIEKGMDENITFGETARIIYNSFDAEILKQTVYGTDGNFSTDGDTVLSYSDIYKFTAVPTANEYTSLYPEGNIARNGAVFFGEREFYAGKSSASEMIGISSEVYALEVEGDNDEVLYICQDNRVKSINVKAAEIDRVDTALIEYYRNGNKRKINIPQNISIIYNGRSVSLNDVDFNITSGYIELYDNDGSGYSTAIIKDYEYCLISSYNGVSEVLNFSDGMAGGKPSIDLGNMEGYKITVNEKAGKVKDLSEGKLVRIALAKDYRYCDIDIITKAVNGTIEKVGSGADMYVIVSGEKYFVEKNALNKEKIEVRKNFKLYINEDNCIVAVYSADKLTSDYAVPVGSKYKTLGGSQIKMFTSDNKMVIFGISGNVKYNGLRVSEEELCTKLDGTNPRIVEYKANVKGELLEITEAVAATGNFEYDKEHLTLHTSVGTSESNRALQTRVGNIGTIGTKTFVVPSRDYIYYADDKYYFKEDYFGYGQVYSNYKMYNVDESRCARLAIAVYGGAMEKSFSAEESPAMFVVSGTGSSLSNDGDVEFAVYGYMNGKEDMITFCEDAYKITGDKEFSNVEVGDVMAYKLDDGGRVDRYLVGFEYGVSEKKLLVKTGNGIDIGRRYQLFYGKCLYKNDNIFTIYCKDEEQIYPMINLNSKGIPIYICNVNNSGVCDVRVGEWADVNAEDPQRGIVGDDVVVHSNGFVVKEIMVIKK